MAIKTAKGSTNNSYLGSTNKARGKGHWPATVWVYDHDLYLLKTLDLGARTRAVAIDANRVYIAASRNSSWAGSGGSNASVWAFNRTTFALEWSLDTGDDVHAVFLQGGAVYVAGAESTTWPGASGAAATVWKLNAATGAISWGFDPGPDPVNALAGDGTFIYAGGQSFGDTIYKLSDTPATSASTNLGFSEQVVGLFYEGGRLWVALSPGFGFKIDVVQLTTALASNWSKNVNMDAGRAIYADAGTGWYVGTYGTDAGDPTDGRLYLGELSSAGVINWRVLFQTSGSLHGVVATDDYVFACGGVMSEYDGSTGQPDRDLFKISKADQSFVATALAADSAGGLEGIAADDNLVIVVGFRNTTRPEL